MRMMLSSCLFLLPSVALCAQAPAAKPVVLADDLVAHRAELRVDPATFAMSGAGRDVLAKAIAETHFVFLGEEHITREVPEFASSVCDLMHPTMLVTETSPQVAQFTEPLLSAPDRVQKMHAVVAKYPASVAFLDVREEQDLAAHCAAGSKGMHFQGLDQTYIGSTSWILDEIVATKPGPHARAAVEKLREQDRAGVAAMKEHPQAYEKLPIITLPDAELAEATKALATEGNARAQWLMKELVVSHEIYGMNVKGSPDSNSTRARLLKQNLQHDLDAAGPLEQQRVLIKFGGWHGYRGYNPLHQRDLGNYVAELADVHGGKSLHIMLTGVKGMHRNFAGFGVATKTDAFSLAEDAPWMKPFLDAQVAGGAWTVFDLRSLKFGKHRPTDPDVAQLVDGYDLLVLIPEVTPATLIDELPQ